MYACVSVLRGPSTRQQESFDCALSQLGRIDYLLSDKTGTLTKNQMEMKEIHLGDATFGREDSEEVRPSSHKQKALDYARLMSSLKAWDYARLMSSLCELFC